jgi:MOSC domain-containing protein YiiM
MNQEYPDEPEIVRTMGTVQAVLISPEHGFPKYPQEMVYISETGIIGDAHSGDLRESFHHPGTYKPNDRPISIVSLEAMEIANELPGVEMEPGDFNENILVAGAGDLGNVQVGDEICFNSGVILEVVDRSYPCLKLEAHNGRGLMKALVEKRDDGTIYSKRGILTRVINPGFLQAGDSMVVVKSEAVLSK